MHYLKLVLTGIVVLFQDRMRVGFMTYDSKINFYNIKGNLSQPQQLTVGDVDDMFVPLVDGLLCSLEESETVIDSLLEQIPIMFGETRETETILAPVIQAGKEAFKVSNDLLPLLFYESFNFSSQGLPKVKLTIACPINSNAYASRAIRSCIDSQYSGDLNNGLVRYSNGQN